MHFKLQEVLLSDAVLVALQAVWIVIETHFRSFVISAEDSPEAELSNDLFHKVSCIQLLLLFVSSCAMPMRQNSLSSCNFKPHYNLFLPYSCVLSRHLSCSAVTLYHAVCLQAGGVGAVLDPDIRLSGIFASPRNSNAVDCKDDSTSSSSAASGTISPPTRPKAAVMVSPQALLNKANMCMQSALLAQHACAMYACGVLQSSCMHQHATSQLCLCFAAYNGLGRLNTSQVYLLLHGSTSIGSAAVVIFQRRSMWPKVKFVRLVKHSKVTFCHCLSCIAVMSAV